jgi:hypothetical protein
MVDVTARILMNRFRGARATNQNGYAAWKVELKVVLVLFG